ncbi:MAG: four-carbon acid sugar kinase family protein [Lawsonibacter sp.]|nr:four-carbon acid sugar kinase family protein [Lawsonibacter sp.]
MIKLLIIADDFTGALDTGVKFSEAGAITKVIADTEMDFTKEMTGEVLVLCAPTRHLPAGEAYQMIRRITEQATAAGIGCIFKKTDSGLRGNIGAELSAVLDGSGEMAISFIPALPAMNRITVEGIHYIDGVPVDQSVFGQDPFEPVTKSYVPDLLHLQCDVPVRVVSGQNVETFQAGADKCIYVFDCASKEDMEQEVQMLSSQDRLKVLAGCAGLAESLPAYLGLAREAKGQPRNRMTVICGSVNPISCDQVDYAERQGGYCRIHIPSEQLLSDGSLWEGDGGTMMDQLWKVYQHSEYLIISSLQNGKESILEEQKELPIEAMRQKVSRRMGMILKNLIDRGADSRFMIIGGDTLLAFLESIQCNELTPVRELQPGVVLSKVRYQNRQYEVISKSGGFGEEDLLVTIQADVEELITESVLFCQT